MVKQLRFLLLCLLFASGCNEAPKNDKSSVTEKDIQADVVQEQRISDALAYCKLKSLDTTIAFFMDVTIRSGLKRFFVWDLQSDKLLNSGLVAHGHCQKGRSNTVEFSNEVGSNCSSEGRYRIGGKYDGRYGTAYKLHGLDASNSNAFKRFVVLHAHSCIPNKPRLIGICRSEGCPTLSPDFLREIEPLLDKSKKPVLLWIYGSKL